MHRYLGLHPLPSSPLGGCEATVQTGRKTYVCSAPALGFLRVALSQVDVSLFPLLPLKTTQEVAGFGSFTSAVMSGFFESPRILGPRDPLAVTRPSHPVVWKPEPRGLRGIRTPKAFWRIWKPGEPRRWCSFSLSPGTPLVAVRP